MATIRALVVRTAGTNCDQETKTAFERVGAKVHLAHVNELLRQRNELDAYQIIAIPGGFTFGDDITAGRILGNELKMKLRDQIERFLKRNGLMIGICNGFQVLVKMGLLPGNSAWEPEATLADNDSGKFEARWSYLRQYSQPSTGRRNCCVWTSRAPERLYLPVAHGEGKFIPRDGGVLQRLAENGQIVLHYCDSAGGRAEYPANPNGSVDAIAGICDVTGRIFGLMPHPERFVTRTQHPRWTREPRQLMADGLAIFQSGMDFLASA